MLLQRGKSANCEAGFQFRTMLLQRLVLSKFTVLTAVQIQDIQDSLPYAVRLSPGVMGTGGKLLRCAFASRTAFGSIGSS